MKQEFKTFRGLLRGAICNRTQAQFSMETGISPEHLNRMLNNDTINRPSKNTLLKIAAAAKNGITYKALADALDREDAQYQAMQAMTPQQREKHEEAVEEFSSIPFRDKAYSTLLSLSRLLNDKSRIRFLYSQEFTSLSEFVEILLGTVEKHGPEMLPVSFDISETRDYYGKLADSGKWADVELTMADWDESASSTLILYYTDAENGKIKITNASMGMEAIADLYGYPPDIYEKYEKKYPDDPAKALEEILSTPFLLDIQPTVRYKEKPSGKNLLDAIFGVETKYRTSLEGFGFWLDEVPQGLCRFVENHMESICENATDAESTKEEWERMVKDALAAHPDDPEALAECLETQGYSDYLSLATGWRAVISAAMQEETGFPFLYYDNKLFPDEEGLEKRPCVMIGDDAVKDNHILRNTLLNMTCAYAKELGLKTFGDIFFPTMESTWRKERTYMVRYDDKEKPEPKEQARKEFVPFIPGKQEPDGTAVYTTLLKDGRRLPCLWLGEQKLWIAFHKEWSGMVKSWCPEKEIAPDEEQAEKP